MRNKILSTGKKGMTLSASQIEKRIALALGAMYLFFIISVVAFLVFLVNFDQKKFDVATISIGICSAFLSLWAKCHIQWPPIDIERIINSLKEGGKN